MFVRVTLVRIPGEGYASRRKAKRIRSSADGIPIRPASQTGEEKERTTGRPASQTGKADVTVRRGVNSVPVWVWAGMLAGLLALMYTMRCRPERQGRKG